MHVLGILKELDIGLKGTEAVSETPFVPFRLTDNAVKVVKVNFTARAAGKGFLR